MPTDDKKGIAACFKDLREMFELNYLPDVLRESANRDLERLYAAYSHYFETAQATRYNGWTNRETWAAWVNISNDVDLSRALSGSNAEDLKRDFERVADKDDLLSIGSLWRVNWDEIAEALIGDAK